MNFGRQTQVGHQYIINVEGIYMDNAEAIINAFKSETPIKISSIPWSEFILVIYTLKLYRKSS